MITYQHEVKYYECDRMGVTHHSNYVRFMEEARVDWLDQLGFGFEKIDIIDIEVKISKMSEMKFEFEYTMRSNGKLVCIGHSAHCFIENGRPVAISKRLPELYNTLMERLSE